MRSYSQKICMLWAIMIFIQICGAQDTVLQDANRTFLERNYAEALTKYQKLFEIPLSDSTGELALFQIAECHRMMDDWDMANKVYLKLVTTYSQSSLADNAYLAMANRLVSQSRNHYPDAISYYETIITRYPGSESEPQAWLGLGKSKETLKLYDQAEDALLRLIKKFPGIPLLGEAYYQLGQLLANPSNSRRNVQLAIQNLQMVVEKYPFSPQLIYAYFALGNLSWETKSYENAIGYYRQVVSNFPDSFLAPLALTNIGLCYTDLRANGKAIESYQELLSKYSQPPAVYDNIQKLIERLQTQDKDKLQVSAWLADSVSGQPRVTNYEGDVQILLGKTTIHCDKATIDLNTNSFVGQGNIRVKSESNLVLTAESMKGNLANKTVMIEGKVNVQKFLGGKIFKESWAALEFSMKDGAYRGFSTPMAIH